jgi:membrane-bound lytic murein transglycosylase B
MKKIKKLLRSCFFSACMGLSMAAGAEEPPLPPVPKAEAVESEKFALWLDDVRKEALEKGIAAEVVKDALPDSLTPSERVLELDRRQPEGTRTFEDYLASTVSPTRVNNGLQRMESYKEVLARVSEAYGVEPEVVVAIWGIESNFGRNMGDFSVVRSLATLAYDGRRSSYFKGELFKALEILDQEKMPSSKLKGSWAGAMGQSQFMPSSYLKLAEDFNGDGKRDIWATEDDVFASAAHYLKKAGWKKGQPWGRRVTLPEGFDESLIDLDNQQPLQFWRDKGLDVPDDKADTAALVRPGGGPSVYIVYDNYRVILKWNRSNYFAASVGALSDKLKPGNK